ncbi:MAG: 3-hydroxyacyl-CoA dehydrogenase NAD-binding domain-containing protein [Alphaproteobacteria bacterium]
MTIQKIAIIGSGQMGAGIAQVAAIAGYDIILNDISKESLEKAISSIEKSLNKFVEKEKLTQQEAQKAMAKIR